MKGNSEADIIKLQEENARLRGDLLTVATRIAHDLRTPLGGIISVAEALKEMFSEDDGSSATRTLVNSLITSSDETSKLIKDMSFILKATANPHQKETVRMEEVIARALQRHEHKILRRGVTIVQPALWPQVNGVFSWLEVIWTNLLSDALERGPNDMRIEIDWREDDGENVFRIQNGVAVPEVQRCRMFQPFDSLHKLDSAGVLGLAIVRRLVELQGGRCGCDDKSSTFFTLPV
jgi:signal transduction histidine kinase